ncbi:hypothetical protein ACSFBX_15225 [Variovorax sp. RB2P76]|uniref:hypothetical protein n=1 Tax=Variovorax sp. RB2P76 TaxID=3443736 RepID=UPI003F4654A1
MAGYIFVSPKSDPGMGRPLLDPLLGNDRRPTMGTCRPDLRRYVQVGGSIFVVSGSLGKHIPQYVIGGLDIDSKLDSQLEAFDKYPENRLNFDDKGVRSGNIILTASGEQHERDSHSKFDSRIKNYLEGSNQVVLESSKEVELGRAQSLDILARVFDQPRASTIREIIGRNRKLSDKQVGLLREALTQLKLEARNG